MSFTNKRYWFITYQRRKVGVNGPIERVSNEAIELHPVDFIYKCNRENNEYYTLLFAMEIDKERYELCQKDCMKKGTRSWKRPDNKRPTW